MAAGRSWRFVTLWAVALSALVGGAGVVWKAGWLGSNHHHDGVSRTPRRSQSARQAQQQDEPDPELPDDIAGAQSEPAIADEAEELPADVDLTAVPEPPSRRPLQGQSGRKTDSRRQRPAADELDEPGSAIIVPANFEDEPVRPATRSADKRTTAPKTADARSAGTKARAAPEPIGEEPPFGAGQKLVDLREIEALAAKGDDVEALQELSLWYWQKPDQRERLLPRLNKLAQPIYFAPQPHYYEPHVVAAGDQLRVVAQRYKLSWEYLARLNQVDARKIRMGQKLKVVPGPFGAVVFLSRYELVIHQQGTFVKSYRVGVGKDGSTPLGTFAVKNKMVDPTYYGPDGVIAHDDPKNPLGERWIDIGDSYGIHGTIEPGSIGRNESRGCIRLLNDDVEEVYDFLVVGSSEVKIQR